MVSKFLPVFRKRTSVEAVIKHPWHVLSWIFKILNTCTYSYWRFSNLHCILYSRWDRWREWKIPCTDLHVHVGRLKQLWLKHFQCMKKIFKPIAEDLIRSGNLFFYFSCTFYIVTLYQFTLTLHAPKYPHTNSPDQSLCKLKRQSR